MRRLFSLVIAFLCGAALAPAQDGLPANRPSDWTCFVTIQSNVVYRPDDPADGLVVLGTFVSTRSSCQAGEVYVGVYPESDCFIQPGTDPNTPEPMRFSYEPRVMTIRVEPGNQAGGTLEIKTGNHGKCSFNTHVASCGTVVPPGAKCVTRKIDDPRTETSGGMNREFNRIP